MCLIAPVELAEPKSGLALKILMNNGTKNYLTPFQNERVSIGRWTTAIPVELVSEPWDGEERRTYVSGFHCFIETSDKKLPWIEDQLALVEYANALTEGRDRNGWGAPPLKTIVAQRMKVIKVYETVEAAVEDYKWLMSQGAKTTEDAERLWKEREGGSEKCV